MQSLHILRACLGALLMAAAGAAWGDRASTITTGEEPGTSLTAENLAAWVLEVNPGVEAVEAAAAAAAFRVEPAGSLDDPTLSYGVAPLTVSADRSLNQTLSLGQKIPWPGTLAAREAVARHEAIAAQGDVAALRLQLAVFAKSAYAEWRFVNESLTIHHATRVLLDELLQATLTRYAAGQALKQDVLQAEVEKANLDKQLLSLARQQATVRARINALLNRDSETPLPPAAPISVQSTLPALEVLQSRAMAQHPELSRLDAQISAGESRVTLAEKSFYPNFQLALTYNGLWDDTDKRPLFGVAINIPLDRSKRRADLNQANASLQRVKWSRIERRAGLLADLAQARAEVHEAQASVALYEAQLVPLAAEYFEATIADYQSGAGSFLNVIAAERRKLSADVELARARADYARRLAELERWVGSSISEVKTMPPGAES